MSKWPMSEGRRVGISEWRKGWGKGVEGAKKVPAYGNDKKIAQKGSL